MMAPQCPSAGGICKITPASLCSRWAIPGYKHGLIKMKLQYMLIPYSSNLNPPPPPTPNPRMCTPTAAHPVKYYNLSQSKRYKSALRNCKNSTKHSQASLYLVRRLWFSIAGVSRPPHPHPSLSLCLWHAGERGRAATRSAAAPCFITITQRFFNWVRSNYEPAISY